MKNNIKEKITDDVIKKLLTPYEDKSDYSEILELKTNKILNNYIEKNNKKFIFNSLFKPIPVFSMGVLVILTLTIAIFSFYKPDLNNKLYVFGPQEFSSKVQTTVKQSIFKTKDNEKINIQADRFIIALKEKTEFRVTKNLFLKDDSYYLKKGTCLVNADRLGGMRFVISTDIADIIVTGTKFEVSIIDNTFKAKCFSGKIVVKSNYIAGKTEDVYEGNEITITKEVNSKPIDTTTDLRIINRITIVIETDVIKNQDIKIPVKENDVLNSGDITKNENSENKKSLKEQWITKVPKNNYESLLVFDKYEGLLTKSELDLFDINGEKTGVFPINFKYESYAISGKNIVFYCLPDLYKVYSIPAFDEVFSTRSGQIAFGKPSINSKYLVISSTDHSIYIYNIEEKKLIIKKEFESGFYSTPLIDDDYVIAGNLNKKLYCYSIVKDKVIWEYNHDKRLSSESPVLSADKSKVLVADEISKVLVLDVKTGLLLYKFDIIKNCNGIAFLNGFLINNGMGIFYYDDKGNIVKSIKSGEISGFKCNADSIYLIKKDKIEVYNINFEKSDELNIETNLFSDYNSFFLLDKSFNLIKLLYE